MKQHSRTYACMNSWCENYKYEIDVFPTRIGPYLAYSQTFYCTCTPQCEVPLVKTVVNGREQRIYNG